VAGLTASSNRAENACAFLSALPTIASAAIPPPRIPTRYDPDTPLFRAPQTAGVSSRSQETKVRQVKPACRSAKLHFPRSAPDVHDGNGDTSSHLQYPEHPARFLPSKPGTRVPEHPP